MDASKFGKALGNMSEEDKDAVWQKVDGDNNGSVEKNQDSVTLLIAHAYARVTQGVSVEEAKRQVKDVSKWALDTMFKDSETLEKDHVFGTLAEKVGEYKSQ